jgi:hypothetical protein
MPIFLTCLVVVVVIECVVDVVVASFTPGVARR